MLEFLQKFQLSFMLFLSGGCGVLIILSLSTRTLSPRRRQALVSMETEAMLLLLADRLAYIYRGDASTTGYYMVRITNFLVFELSLFVIHSFDLYLMDLYTHSEKVKKIPKPLVFCEVLFTIGIILVVVSQFTGLYYTFDEHNYYHRASGYIISYVIPLLIMLLQFIVIVRYRSVLDDMVLTPIILFAVIPYLGTILQYFFYGLSIINITMVGMCVALYFFEIINMNKVQQARIKAESANNAKARFLANISHEIRTPINTIMGMDEMILRENPTGVPKPYFMSVVGYAYDIKAASETLLSLINDILDISKIESGKMNLVEKEYDVTEQIRSLYTMISVRSNQKNLNFDLDIDETIPKKLYGDAGKIKQIVLNLLTNAVKYTEKGGFKLTIKVLGKENDDCRLHFSVQDTGSGIRKEDMDKLFSAFERVDEAKNSGIQGTGLGLAISKQFAELMGGRLWCESEYGKGSTFSFEVSQRIIDEEPIGEFDEQADIPVRGPYLPKFIAPEARILIVDDNIMNLNVIVGLLKVTQIQTLTATSGEECLNLLQEEKVDMVLLDHMMAGMDGIETLKRLREVGHKIPVVALTANYFQDAEEVYASYGFDGYLPKPVNSLELEDIIIKNLPTDKVVLQDDTYHVGTQEEDIPQDMKWLCNVDSIDLTEGIKNSGGAIPFIYSIKFFYETIEDNIEVIEKAYNDRDIKLYVIKVHALKASARIIGAMKLYEMAKDIEKAGKGDDLDYIDSHHKMLIEEYRSYIDILSGIKEARLEGDVTKVSVNITSDELSSAYKAIYGYADQMDYDALEQILNKLKEYRLSSDDKKIMTDIEKASKKYEWDRIKELVKK